MNREKYARLTVVVDLRTDKALRYLSQVTDRGVSEIVRELISEPAAAMADTFSGLNTSDPDSVRAALDNMDLFVADAYADYTLTRRNGS